MVRNSDTSAKLQPPSSGTKSESMISSESAITVITSRPWNTEKTPKCTWKAVEILSHEKNILHLYISDTNN
jgi:hypothetical protein